MDTSKAIRLLALKSVLDPDYEAFLRKVFRWYSRTFTTPLHVVEDLPVTYILQHYYEAYYEKCNEPELEVERGELLETDEERKKREWEEYLAEIEADQYAKDVEKIEGKKAPAESEPTPQKDKLTEAIDSLKKLSSGIDIPKPEHLPPDISMEFLSPEEFEKEIEGFGLLDTPRKKQS